MLRSYSTKREIFKMMTALIGLLYMINIILVVIIGMGGTDLSPEAAWGAGFLTLILPLVWLRAMIIIAKDQNAREARFEIIEEDFNASDLDWEGGALDVDSKYTMERGE
tara:strand:- start:247 stop:573 length:327 start_codon:yes stop_codon:yes gene_type:complete